MKRKGPQVSPTYPTEAEGKGTAEWDGARWTVGLRAIFASFILVYIIGHAKAFGMPMGMTQ